ncbi:hypothetical protein [Brachyspira pulli]|uniref:hypothetical protein n=1 Tax=Brachyspira pulli TaxID=310721 RepID=UPI003005BE14
MRKMKRLLLIAAALLITNISVFAASGFEAIVNVPLGLSVGIPTGTYDAIDLGSMPGFDSGVTAQLGYMIGIGKIGVSILGELGYSYDSYRYYYSIDIGNFAKEKTTIGLHTHSFQIGLLPKINIGSFAIGVGAGVKIPVSAYSTTKTEASLGNWGGTINSGESKLNRDDIENLYSRNVIPYLKVTFDYSFFFNNKMAFNVGAYLGYDFGLAEKSTIDNEYTGVDSFDIGLQLGLRFAPKL